MNHDTARHLVDTMIAMLALSLAGCSSAQKTAKGPAASGSETLTASAKQVQQDFTKTESDFSKLESQFEVKK